MPDDVYYPAAGVRFGYSEARFVIAVIDHDDDGCTLHLVIQAPDDPSRIRRAQVSLPIGVQGNDLVVGTPRVSYLTDPWA